MSDPESVEPVFTKQGDGSWLPAPVARGPFDGLQGGAVAGLLCAEMEWAAAASGAGLPVSVTAHLFRPAPPAPLRTSVSVVHSGRRFSVLENRLSAESKDVALARACFVAPLATDGVPELPLRQRELEGLPPRERPSPHGGPWFMDTMDARVDGDTFWFRVHRPLLARPAELARVVTVADWAHGLGRPDSWETPAVRAIPNPELTVHLTRRPTGEWIGVQATTHFRKDGIGCGRALLWDEHGEIGAVAMAVVLVP